jgi:hypothetical protein
MNKSIMTTLAVGFMAGSVFAEVSITTDFSSAYVFRGATLNDGFVIQPGIEASGLGLPEVYGSVTVGAWGNFDLDDYAPVGAVGSSFQETDWYGSYHLPPFVEGLDLFIGYTEYSYGAGGNMGTSSYTEFAVGYGFDFTETFSGSVDARLGYANQDGGETGFQDYDISASLGYALGESWSIGASLVYIGQGDDIVLPEAPSAYDVDLVGMLSFAYAL